MRTVALSFALLGVVAALHLRPPTPNHNKTPKMGHGSETFTPTAESSLAAQGEPIFYMTAMNKLAGKHQTRLWLSSVRKTGKWKGEIALVTDLAECLAKNLGVELLGGPKMDISNEVMDVYPGGEGMGKIYMLKQPVTSKVKEMKQEKAFAWKNMEKLGLKPSFIVYTDQDIVFGNDVNVVIDGAKQKFQNKGYTLCMFIDQGVSKGQLHTGIIFIFPGPNTDQCLSDWGKKILATSSSKYHGFNKDKTFSRNQESQDAVLGEEAGAKLEADAQGPDQKALGNTHSCKAGSGMGVLDKEHLLMPTDAKLTQERIATFIHFTNTNRWKSIKAETMKTYFTSVLHLPDMDWFTSDQCEGLP